MNENKNTSGVTVQNMVQLPVMYILLVMSGTIIESHVRHDLPELAVLHPLGHLVHLSLLCANVEDGELLLVAVHS
jgi:hypothetical protein